MNHLALNFDHLRNSSVGTVESISAQKIDVLLETDAPQSTAINTGIPTRFPRINSFVLIPNESGALVGLISWLGTKQASYPKRRGYKDFDLVDLPFPLRKMVVIPLGTLKRRGREYVFERGVYSFPSIGDAVVIPSLEQISAIVQNRDENALVPIGSAPIAGDRSVLINPDRLFGRHCAILGNTGSGKSCTVAGLMRWSIEAAREHRQSGQNADPLNMRFIVLDPNNEYGVAFDDLQLGVRKYRVNLHGADKHWKQLLVPAWLWNSEEWASISQASQRAQLPLLKQALRQARSQSESDNTSERLRRMLEYFVSGIRTYLEQGGNVNQWRDIQDVTRLLVLVRDNLSSFENDSQQLTDLVDVITEQINQNSSQNLRGYSALGLERLVELSQDVIALNFKADESSLPSEDLPTFFSLDTLLANLQIHRFGRDSGRYLDYFISRVRALFSDSRMLSVIKTGEAEGLSLENWLEDYIGSSGGQNGEICIIDLSLVSSELIHLIVAVMSRLIFEATQRYKRENGGESELPTVLVLEEAHTFIRRPNVEEGPASLLSYGVFEKIAREGRKFGLGLLLSSQRPSELSPTVLSQCNTFILHRIVNDLDQDLVKRLVPDVFSDMLSELPVLPTGEAVLLGWASPIPLVVKITQLQEGQKPSSSDPSFWDVWTGKQSRDINWERIARTWQGREMTQ